MTTIRFTGVMLAAAVLLAPAASRAEDAKPNTKCQLCGMDAARSDTAFVLHPKSGPDLYACCANCARRVLARVGTNETAVTVLDYGSRRQVPAAEAAFVLGSSAQPKGSMPPYVFAFGARKAADDFAARHGGRVLAFPDLMAELAAR